MAKRFKKKAWCSGGGDASRYLSDLEEWGFNPEEVRSLTPFDSRYTFAQEGYHYLILGEKLEDIRP